MDSQSISFVREANRDNGKCFRTVYGCAAESATNYNPAATVTQGCVWKVEGCSDNQASNYASDVTEHIASTCKYTKMGCMFKAAQNYDPTATKDDSSCVLASPPPSPRSSPPPAPKASPPLSPDVYGAGVSGQKDGSSSMMYIILGAVVAVVALISVGFGVYIYKSRRARAFRGKESIPLSSDINLLSPRGTPRQQPPAPPSPIQINSSITKAAEVSSRVQALANDSFKSSASASSTGSVAARERSRRVSKEEAIYSLAEPSSLFEPSGLPSSFNQGTPRSLAEPTDLFEPSSLFEPSGFPTSFDQGTPRMSPRQPTMLTRANTPPIGELALGMVARAREAVAGLSPRGRSPLSQSPRGLSPAGTPPIGNSPLSARGPAPLTARGPAEEDQSFSFKHTEAASPPSARGPAPPLGQSPVDGELSFMPNRNLRTTPRLSVPEASPGFSPRGASPPGQSPRGSSPAVSRGSSPAVSPRDEPPDEPPARASTKGLRMKDMSPAALRAAMGRSPPEKYGDLAESSSTTPEGSNSQMI